MYNDEILELIVESYEDGNISLEEASVLMEATENKGLGTPAKVAIAGLTAGTIGSGVAGAIAYKRRKAKEAARIAEEEEIERRRKESEEINTKSEGRQYGKENDSGITYRDIQQARRSNTVDRYADEIHKRKYNRVKRDYELMDIKRDLDKRIRDDNFETRDLERDANIKDTKARLELQKIDNEIREIARELQGENVPPSRMKVLKNKLTKLMNRKRKLSED